MSLMCCKLLLIYGLIAVSSLFLLRIIYINYINIYILYYNLKLDSRKNLRQTMIYIEKSVLEKYTFFSLFK